MATAHHNLGVVCNQLGELESARLHLKEAIRLRPDYAEAYHSLARSGRFAADEEFLQRVEDLCHNDRFSRRDLSFLHFAAGKILNDMGEYERAFAHYRLGNKLHDASYDRNAEERYVADQIEVFGPSLFDRFKERGNASDAPIFIVGMPRSGTTLAEQVLSSHPKVKGVGELKDIHLIAGMLAQRTPDKLRYPRCLDQIDPAVLDEFSAKYFERTARLAPGADRVVDKNPANYRLLGLLAVMFPNAHFIHCTRSALDTCVSCYVTKFNDGLDYSFSLKNLGHYYRQYDRLMKHWRDVLPAPIFELRYEDMIMNQERTTRDLLDFCGLPWDPQCERFFETERAVRTASSWQVRQPLYSSSVDRWKRYESGLAPLIEALGPLADT
jgi:tetratricopeptide (TPR) repeat protein